MSQDFFADLERELVAAAGERGRRLRRARARRTAALSTVLVAVLAAGAGLAAAVTGGDGDARHSAPAGHGATTAGTVGAVSTAGQIWPEPGRFTVAVLNGTTLPGLARGVANHLVERHHKIGTVTNAADQDTARTIVYFARPDCKSAAARVASDLAEGRGSTVLHTAGPAPAALRAIAGNEADVIVVAGRIVPLGGVRQPTTKKP